MADPATFFESASTEATPAVESAPVVSPAVALPDEAKELIGEGKKYKSIEDALKALPHAQNHIQKLEEENQKYRDEMDKRKSSEDMLKELRELYSKPIPKVEDFPDVQKVVLDTINKLEDGKTKDQNLKFVHEEMTRLFGTNAEKMVQAKAQELGYPISELKREAMLSPKAFLERFSNMKSGDLPASSGSISTDALASAPVGVKTGTKAWYDQLRKSDPTKFYSPAIQNQMFRDRKEKGENYYK